MILLKTLEIFNELVVELLSAPRSGTPSAAIFHLHWLPVIYRARFKLPLLVYKALNNQAPEYLKDFLQPYFITAHRLRSRGQSLLKVPRTRHKTFGDRAFAHSGPSLWNELPFDIRSSPTVTVFKSKLKTYLMTCFNIFNL